jgi:putative two-component system response regulator
MWHAQAAHIMVEGCGSHFGPDIVDAFPTVQNECRDIAMHFCDNDQAKAALKRGLQARKATPPAARAFI